MLVSSLTRFARPLLLCFLSCTVLSAAIAADAPKPNVVFILADDLGWTDLAVQGSKYYQTPNIDKLAAGGMRFTSGYTCGPNCQPTRAALMSGQYGPRTGVYTVGDIGRFDWQSRPLKPVDNVQDLPLDRVTVAGALKHAGYVTGMFGKWHLGSSDRYQPWNRGFDEAIVSAGEHFDFKTKPETQHDPEAYLADFLTDKATDFIRRHKSEPFFLYLPHFGVHAPHHAKKELIAKFSPRDKSEGHFDPTYAAMIASVDESVGRVVATLDELGLSKNTLVIFASDNGGVGGYERYGIQGKSITDNAPLHGGKGMLYEGGIRVPYIFRWPGVIPAGVVCDEPINSVDLYPTLLELTGAEKPQQPLDGLSYLAMLKSGGEKKLNRDAIYWHFPGYLGAGEGTWRTFPAGAIRSGDWKLLEFFEDGHLELYNLRDDLGETKNLAESQPEKAKELHAKLVKWRQEIHAPMPTRNEATTTAAEESTKPKARKGKGKGKKARKAKQAQAEQQESEDDEAEQLETKTSAIESENSFHAVRCEGTYPGHLQGICTNDRDAIYWSFTTELVKTDPNGHIQKKIDVATHHGDLCHLDGKLYVAVNLGQFNLPAGKADSWVYVYDAESLAELARHPVQEAVHGAGGIAWHDGKFFVVGGLPIGSKENYVFEYDSEFKFQQRRVLASGYTFLGIQTVCWADGAYWFGCYGSPRILLKADPQLNLTGRWKLDASLGLVAIPGGKLLVASGAKTPERRNTGALSVAVPDEQLGLRVLEAPAN